MIVFICWGESLKSHDKLKYVVMMFINIIPDPLIFFELIWARLEKGGAGNGFKLQKSTEKHWRGSNQGGSA